MVKVQVTYFCENGKYKPISTIIEVPSSYAFVKNKEYWINRAKTLIKNKRYWTDADMEKYGYTEHKERLVPSK